MEDGPHFRQELDRKLRLKWRRRRRRGITKEGRELEIIEEEWHPSFKADGDTIILEN